MEVFPTPRSPITSTLNRSSCCMLQPRTDGKQTKKKKKNFHKEGALLYYNQTFKSVALKVLCSSDVSFQAASREEMKVIQLQGPGVWLIKSACFATDDRVNLSNSFPENPAGDAFRRTTIKSDFYAIVCWQKHLRKKKNTVNIILNKQVLKVKM